MKKFLAIILVLGVLGAVALYKFVPKHYYICYILKKDYNKEQKIAESWQRLEITQGQSLLQIANFLKQKKLIDDPEYFVCYVTKNKHSLKSGIFYLPEKLSINKLINILENPQDPYIHVRLPEGYRIDQTSKKLAEYFSLSPFKNFDKDRFANIVNHPETYNRISQFEFYNIIKPTTLEGFLFPTGYDFYKDVSDLDVLNAILSMFNKKAWPKLKQAQEKVGLSPYDALKIASIVEREASRDFEEKRMIADIIIRRYKNGWLLQTDAVLLYPYRDWSKTLTLADLKKDTPYNVYMHKGLPPTPICSPGLASIEAVLNPKPNNYWYYLHDKSGKVHYSISFPEHAYKVNKYLR